MSNPITEQILGAWDEVESEAPDIDPSGTVEPVDPTGSEETADEAVPDEVIELDDEPKTPDEEEEVVVEVPSEEVEDEEASSEEEEPEPSGDEEPSASYSSDDAQIQAFLARYDGDVEAALKAAVNQDSLLGRQGRELGELRAHAAQLQSSLEQASLFASGGRYLNEEQQAWVEEAASSGDPAAYLQQAVAAQEFDLARAVLDVGEFPTGQAIRFSQAIDRAEVLAAPEQVQPLEHNLLMEVLIEHYPDMPTFESEMVSTLHMLGREHPLSVAAHSQDPAQAAQGIIGLYEIARAKTATVQSTRDEVRTRQRQAGADARRRAQVTSAQAAPTQAQTPRTRQLMPGLTLEALEAEFEVE